MPAYTNTTPISRETLPEFWESKTLRRVTKEVGELISDQRIQPLVLGTFAARLHGMATDGLDGLDFRGTHTAYVVQADERHSIRDLLERLIFDFVSSTRLRLVSSFR